ncbi:MAG: hypothetical protein RL563_717 [Pseudomonadota bacterium]
MLNVVNYYEQLVADRIWKLSESSEEVLSKSFLDDVACLTLNQLPPCYVCNSVDKGIHILDSQQEVMAYAVDQAFQFAIQQAKNRPHERR